MNSTLANSRLLLSLAAAGLTLGSLSACVPLVVGAAAVGGATMIAVDRRSSGAQLDDEGIELRAGARMRAAADDETHVNITSWNRQVLITGEASSEAMRQRIGQEIASTPNVRSVVNDLAVMPPSTVTARSGDAFITSKVKTSLVNTKDILASAYKVVTERGIVYLMGKVTQREADRATDVARSTSGVNKVVRVLEVVSEADLNNKVDAPVAPNAGPAPVTSTLAPVAPASTVTPIAAPAAVPATAPAGSSRVPLPPMAPLPARTK